MIGANVIAGQMNQAMMRNDLLDSTTQKLQALANGPLDKASAKMVASEFESLFIGQMLEHMMSGDSLGEDMFGSSESDDIYKSMMVTEYSKAIQKSGGIGIAAYIERSLNERALLKAQEV